MLNTGSLSTSGSNASGMYGLSEGGAGAQGGDDSWTPWSKPGPGGKGGNSGARVMAANLGSITTSGIASDAIHMRSVGGNGGNGGVRISPLGIAIGGDGGNGGSGGSVLVLNKGDVRTTGSQSDAISAQSVGGGGGDGGLAVATGAFASIAIGGSGGGGGPSDAVEVFNEGGSLSTSGKDAMGVRAQSIGGGGGNGGGSVAFAAGAYVSLSVSIGGSGGPGGNGGLVRAFNDMQGSIVTGVELAERYRTATELNQIDPLTAYALGYKPGGNAHGLFAQSIGGGGGSGGSATSLSAAAGDSFALAIATAIGGKGGAGGNSGEVLVSNLRGSVATYDRFSHALFAQSVGGGGGSGGDTITVAASASGEVSGNVGVSLGGSGGSGGNAGLVTVNTGTTLKTFGAGSNAVLAQSIGGGGGNGGSVLDVGVGIGSTSLSLGVNLGGSGGGGGSGGSVRVNPDEGNHRQTTINTYGDIANGILAQSVGGGGGSGGSVNTYAVGIQAGEGSATTATVNLGGKGGNGGKGGSVSVNYDGKLTTFGNLSSGILSQSIGGGGGSGGSVSAISVAASLNANEGGESSKGGAVTASVNLGGKGGSGNDGGNVDTRLGNNSNISTYGSFSNAVTAQSIGGGGGNGGDARSFSLATSMLSDASSIDNMAYKAFQKISALVYKDPGAPEKLQKSLQFSANLGGSGGAGGAGGKVLVNVAGKISTAGPGSAGVFAQSVGGGGGNGGQAEADGLKGVGAYAINLGLGGSGNAGGNGDRVWVTSTPDTAPAAISVQGDTSTGIMAQSIGGGGGKAGAASTQPGESVVPVPVVGGLTAKASISLSFGGQSGAGGDGGEVASYTGANINAQGKNTVGILAQSIGGGGGKADTATAAGGKLNLSFGGSGGAGGNGGLIKLANFHINTNGGNSTGLLAQSIGGGGGVGGISNATGGLISLGFEVGGQGGRGGNGGAVNVGCADEYATWANCAGDVSTNGAVAHGIIAQSIGGGGGITQISRFNLSESIKSWTFNIKGSSNNGSSGTVTVQDNEQSHFHIRSSGAGAIGIVAQSLSGAGGNIQLEGALGDVSFNTDTLAINGNGGSNSGVNVNLYGDVGTSGDYAHGIYMQSLFGAITAFGTDGSRVFGGYAKTANGQNKIVTRNGSAISTTGAGANAIYSLTNDNAGSWAQGLDLSGTVSATGANAWAVKAVNGINNKLLTGGGSINANVYGIISGGKNSAGAISLENYNGGDSSLIIRNGGGVQLLDRSNALTDCPLVPGCTVIAMTGRNNSLEILEGSHVSGGTVRLGTTGGTSTVRVDGVLRSVPEPDGNGDLVVYSHPAIELSAGTANITIGSSGQMYGGLFSGAAGYIINNGYLQGQILAQSVAYENNNIHVLKIFGNGLNSDTINARSVTVPASGKIRLELASLPSASFSPVNLITASNYSFAGVPVVAAGSATQLSFDEKIIDGGKRSIILTGIRVGFGGVSGLTPELADAAALANNQVNALASSHTPPLLGNAARTPLYDLLLSMANESDPSRLAAGLGNFAVGTSNAESALAAVWYTANHLQSCGDDKLATISAIEQGSCDWTKLAYENTQHRDGSNKNRVWSINVGKQRQVNTHSYVGLNAGFGTTDFTSGSNFNADGQRVTLGGIAKYVKNNIFASASLVGGYAWADGERSISAPGITAVAKSDSKTLMLASRLRGGYNFNVNSTINLTPSLDLNIPVIRDLGYDETGSGAFDMQMLSSTNVVPDVHPAIQLGSHFNVGKASVRAWVELGGRFRFNDVDSRVRMHNSFAPDQTTSITYRPDREAIVGNAGLLVECSDKLELRLVYEGERGRTAESQSGSIKLAWKF